MPTLQDPPEYATRTQRCIWEMKVDEFVKRETQLEENIQILYLLVWGQYTDIMRQRFEALDTFEVMSESKNGLELLRAIKKYHSMSKAKRNWRKHYMNQSAVITLLHRQGKQIHRSIWSNTKVLWTCSSRVEQQLDLNQD
jgi:hypothetical protein